MVTKTQYIVEGENRTGRLFSEIDRDLNAFDKRMSKIGRLGVTVGAAVAAAVGGAKAIGSLREFEVLNASLETVTGSGAGAEAALAWIEPFAAKTPFQLEEVIGAFVKMSALGLKPSERDLVSYGNTASAMGKSLDQLIEAVADASTGEFERLKEFGIKSSTQGDQVTFTFRGISTTVQKESEAIVGYLQSIGEVDFDGAMARRAATLDGTLSNLEDSVASLVRAMGDAGLTTASQDAAAALATLTGAAAAAVRENKSLLAILPGIGSGIAELARGDDVQRLGELEAKLIGLEQVLSSIENRQGFVSGGRANNGDRLRAEIERTKAEILGLQTVLQPAQFGQVPAGEPAPAPGPTRAGLDTSTPARKQSEIDKDLRLVDETRKLNRDFARDKQRLDVELAESAEDLSRQLRDNQAERLADLERSLLSERELIEVNRRERLQVIRVAEAQGLETATEFAALRQKVEADATAEINALTERQMKAAAKEGEEAFERLTRAVQGWADDSADAFVDFATGAKGSFSGLVESMLRDIAKLAARQVLFDPLGDFISGGLKNAAGSGGGFLSSLLSKVAGSRASGGPVSGNRPFLVGERGPELFVPSTAGRVMAAGGGGVINNIEIINHTSANVTPETHGVVDGENNIRLTIGELVDEHLTSGAGARTMRNTFGAGRQTVVR